MHANPPRAVVCAGPALGLVLVEVARSAGFDVAAVVDRAVDAAVEVARARPAAVLVDVSTAGHLGTEAVSLVRRLSPDSVVIALVPFAELTERVLANGATAALLEDDLRQLPALLAQASGASVGSESTNPRPAS